jgi:protein-disulfide isomerase
MSGKQDREKRRQEREQAGTATASGERRTKLMQLAAGAVFLAVAVIVALIVINGSSSDSAGEPTPEDASEVAQTLQGIPQHGMVLGAPSAPVELAEFGDLQCPVCKGYAEEILPGIIENQVKNGEVKIDFRNFTIIGPQSLPAGAGALAAGEQGHGWNYVELFYKNQGAENSGYADDAFLKSIARAAGVKNMAQWNQDRAKLTSKVEETTEEAQELDFSGTPSFALKGPNSKNLEPIGTPRSIGALEEAIERAG